MNTSLLCVIIVLTCACINRTRARRPLQVFDNYAVTVMIGEDPYTLGLFDTAGACLARRFLPRTALTHRGCVV